MFSAAVLASYPEAFSRCTNGLPAPWSSLSRLAMTSACACAIRNNSGSSVTAGSPLFARYPEIIDAAAVASSSAPGCVRLRYKLGSVLVTWLSVHPQTATKTSDIRTKRTGVIGGFFFESWIRERLRATSAERWCPAQHKETRLYWRACVPSTNISYGQFARRRTSFSLAPPHPLHSPVKSPARFNVLAGHSGP